MKYPNGQPVQIGDLVWWNEGSCIGFVQSMVESEEDCQTMGLKGPHLFISSRHPFDSNTMGVAYPIACFEDEGIAPLALEELDQFEKAKDFAASIARNDLMALEYSVNTECVDGQMAAWTFKVHQNDAVIETIRVPWPTM